MEKEDKGLINLFSAHMFVALLGTGIVNTVFVLFLEQVKGFSTDDATFIIGITPLILLPCSFFWGWVMDKHKKLIMANKIVYASNAIMVAVLIWVSSFVAIFGFNLLRNFLTQPSGGINDEYILHIVKKTGHPYGKIRVWGAIGFGASGLLVPIIMYFYGVTASLIAAIIILLCDLIILSKLPEVKHEKKVVIKEEKPSLKSTLSLFKNKKFVVILVVLTILTTTCNITGSFAMPIMLVDLKAPDELVGMLPFIMVLMEIVFLLVFHKLKIAKKSYTVIFICVLISIVRWYLMATIDNYYILTALMLCHGVVIGMILPTQNKLLGEIIPKHQRSTAFLFQLAIAPTVFASVLNLFTGYLSTSVGIHIFGFTYLVLAIIALIAILPTFIKSRTTYKAW